MSVRVSTLPKEKLFCTEWRRWGPQERMVPTEKQRERETKNRLYWDFHSWNGGGQSKDLLPTHVWIKRKPNPSLLLQSKTCYLTWQIGSKMPAGMCCPLCLEAIAASQPWAPPEALGAWFPVLPHLQRVCRVECLSIKKLRMSTSVEFVPSLCIGIQRPGHIKSELLLCIQIIHSEHSDSVQNMDGPSLLVVIVLGFFVCFLEF